MAIPTSQVKGARERFKAGFSGNPRKWQNADEEIVKYVFVYLKNRSFPIVILHIQTDTPEWKKFVDRGEEFLRNALAKGDQSIAGLSISEFLKGTLVYRVFALLCSHCLKNYGAGIVVDSSEQKPVFVDLVTDEEFNNRIVIDLLKQSIQTWEYITDLHRLGIKPTVEMSFGTEEDEPLLLLPDHVAGLFRLVRNNNISPPPKVSREYAGRLAQDYCYLDLSRFLERLEKFEETSISMRPPWPTSKGLETAP